MLDCELPSGRVAILIEPHLLLIYVQKRDLTNVLVQLGAVHFLHLVANTAHTFTVLFQIINSIEYFV
jgi:hypothetical protein